MKRVFLLCLLFAVAVAQREYLLDEKSSNPESSICRAGEVVSFKISSNPTSGYTWYFEPSNSIIGTLLNGFAGTFLPPTSGLMGAPGHQQFLVKCWENARVRDTYSFRLTHRRAFEQTEARTKLVTILVEA